MTQKLQKISQKVQEAAPAVFDVRVIGIVMFLVVALMITWSGVHVIDKNYTLQQQIAELQQKNEIEQLKNETAALQNKYYESNEYVELEARKTLGLAAPGETVWVVPKEVALKHTVPPRTTEAPQVKQSAEKQSNFSAWMDFLFHRQSGDS